MPEYTSLGQYIKYGREQAEQIRGQRRAQTAQALARESEMWGKRASYEKAAEQIKQYGQQMLGGAYTESPDWRDIMTRGVDYYTQGIDYQVQQREYGAVTGEEPTVKDKKTGTERPMTKLEMAIGTQKKNIMDNVYVEASKKYPAVIGTGLWNDYLEKSKNVSLDEMPKFNADYEAKFADKQKAERYKDKILEELVYKNINLTAEEQQTLKGLDSYNEVRAFYLPKLSSALKSALEIQKTIETQDNVIKALKEVSEDENMLAVIPELSQRKEYEGWFNLNNTPTEETLNNPYRMNEIRRAATRYKTVTATIDKKIKNSEQIAATKRGTVVAADTAINERYENDLDMQSKVRETLIALQEEGSKYKITQDKKGKPIVQDSVGNTILKKDDAQFVKELNSQFSTYNESLNFEAIEKQIDLEREKKQTILDNVIAGISPMSMDYVTQTAMMNTENADNYDFSQTERAKEKEEDIKQKDIEEKKEEATFDKAVMMDDKDQKQADAEQAKDVPVEPISNYESIMRTIDKESGMDSITITTGKKDVYSDSHISRRIKAHRDGRIIAVNANSVVVLYNDGVAVRFDNIKPRYDLKRGVNVNKGDYIAGMLNKKGYKPKDFDPGYVNVTAWKPSLSGNTEVDAEKYLFGGK